jgi:hypothetical protein
VRAGPTAVGVVQQRFESVRSGEHGRGTWPYDRRENEGNVGGKSALGGGGERVADVDQVVGDDAEANLALDASDKLRRQGRYTSLKLRRQRAH